MITTIYNEMWDRFTEASLNNCCHLDPLINSATDTRRGITALAYLQNNNPRVTNNIASFLAAIRQIEPEQYYYQSADFHLTILSIISCVKDFALSTINSEQYTKTFHDVMAECPPIEINFCGVTASESCVVIQGFPNDNSLQVLREKLKKAFKDFPNVTIDSRYKLITAHSSVIRFCQPLKDSQKLLELCHQYRNHSFGSIIFTQFDLVFNNWYQQQAHTRYLATANVINL